MNLNVVLKSLVFLIPILLSVAFLTLLERKILGLIGIRVGPWKVSFLGLLQPISDAVKLSNKQVNTLFNFSMFFYYCSAFLMLFCSLLLWTGNCSFSGPLSWSFSFLVILMVLSVNSFNSILLGWSTCGKFSLIGSLRTVSQLISYEAVLYLVIFFLCYYTSSFSVQLLSDELKLFFCFGPILMLPWAVSVLAELNRTPYDFSEGESELVSGFNTEFGSGAFTCLFLAEYSNIIFMSYLTSFIFLNSFKSIFGCLFFLLVIWIRAVLPRFRFDKLMSLAWKILIPVTTLYLLAFMAFLF